MAAIVPENDNIMATKPQPGTPQHVLWLGIGQALIMVLGAIETYLELERSITPRHKR